MLRVIDGRRQVSYGSHGNYIAVEMCYPSLEGKDGDFRRVLGFLRARITGMTHRGYHHDDIFTPKGCLRLVRDWDTDQVYRAVWTGDLQFFLKVLGEFRGAGYLNDCLRAGSL